jgi:hypothetical protein
MNKTLLTATLGALTCVVALGQGSFNFSSNVQPLPKVVGIDGNAVSAGIQVEVLAFNSTSSSFESLATSGLLATPASRIGVFSGGTVAIPFIAPGGTAELMVRAWDTATGATYADAAANPAGIIGSSGSFSVSSLGGFTGGDPNNPANTLLPAAIVFAGGGYQGIQLELVPEPSTYALAALGLGGLLFFRRKK